MLREIFLLLFATVAVPASVIFEDCGSAYDLYAVNIRGCGMRLPCYVTLGENIPVSLDFFADFSSRQLDQNVVININYVNLKTPVTPEPCEILGCPVRTDAMTSFTSVMSVPNSMALDQRGYLNWKVFNENGRMVLCYSVLVQTQSPLQKILREILEEMTPVDPDNTNDLSENFPTPPDVFEVTQEENNTDGFLQKLIKQYQK